MLKDIYPREELAKLAKQKAKRILTKTVHAADVEEEQKQGWELKGYSKNKKRAYLFREKPKPTLLESRVWTLLYKMGFDFLSGEAGAWFEINPKDPESPVTQIDCVAIDSEIGLACECKTFEELKRDPDFSSKLAELTTIKRAVTDAIKKQFPLDKEHSKRHIATVLFTWDFELTEANIKRAEAHNVSLIDEKSLEYYEKLVEHLGPAARYQFLYEIFPSTQIEGLRIEGMPALKTKAGKTVCYTFSMRPENLLKIAYVAHRAKGRQKGQGVYQRMCTKQRLKKIAKYISDGGNFPTNIVLNIEDSRFVRFDQGEQKGGTEGAKIGTLTLSPTYGSAWVIDGQHRLFAYSGLERAKTSYLNVLAFEGLSEDDQAKLFVDINHEQKSVKSNLLDELWADLHWKSRNDDIRIRAVIARAIQELNGDKASPFYGRILLADDKMTDHKCISLTSVTSALDKANLYIARSKRDATEHKAFWGKSNEEMLKRTKDVLNAWFNTVTGSCNEWWAAGRGDGGGLAMNNGVTVCINVLKDVLDYLGRENKLFDLRDNELIEITRPYAEALGNSLGHWSAERKIEFRSWVGGLGQDKGTMAFNEEIHKKFPTFEPQGLKDFVEARETGTRTQAFELISSIETALKKTIIPTLKKHFHSNPNDWWFRGVPKNVRKKVDDKINESDGAEGDREQNLDLIHYREILIENWKLFEAQFGKGAGNAKAQTGWLVEINTIRKYTDHDKGRLPTVDEVKKLRECNAWVQERIKSYVEAVPPTSPISSSPVTTIPLS